MTTGLLIAAIAVLLIVLIIAVSLLVRAQNLAFHEKVQARLGMQRVFLKTTKAICAGTVKDKGYISVGRGYCGLAVAKSGIISIPVYGDTIVIPYDRITEVYTTKKHGGKAQIREMLAVAYTSEGTELKTAWQVPDILEWKAGIERMIRA